MFLIHCHLILALIYNSAEGQFPVSVLNSSQPTKYRFRDAVCVVGIRASPPCCGGGLS
eukprot:m.373229 g.373229  ORF g.373229 m.373229 type:complete len:58 (-) comp28161_c0_seq12:120-293(-)